MFLARSAIYQLGLRSTGAAGPGPSHNDTTSDPSATLAWTSQEANTIQALTIGIVTTLIALAALFLTYRQLKAMRQARHLLPCNACHRAENGRARNSGVDMVTWLPDASPKLVLFTPQPYTMEQ